MRTFKRGQVYHISGFEISGQEQRPGRPAIIVSNNKCNFYSTVVEIVYLSSTPKKQLPTHVLISAGSIKKESTALCEQIHSISIEKIADQIGCLSKDEMERVNEALMISLDLLPIPESHIDVNSFSSYEKIIESLKTELKVYKNLYEKLLQSIIK